MRNKLSIVLFDKKCEIVLAVPHNVLLLLGLIRIWRTFEERQRYFRLHLGHIFSLLGNEHQSNVKCFWHMLSSVGIISTLFIKSVSFSTHYLISWNL